MAFSPIPDGSMPSPDDVLARLAPGPGEGGTGYITKEDLAFAWQVFLSQAINGKTLVQAVDSALIALTTRVTALEAAGGSFTTVPTAANLNAVATNGSISVALDTGQWFLRKNGAWTTLGLDVTGASSVLAKAVQTVRTPKPATGELGLPNFAGSDTGWRDISTLLANGWAGTLEVRRMEHVVSVRGVLTTAGTTADVATLPSGFRANKNQAPFLVTSSTAVPAAADIAYGLIGGSNTAVVRVNQSSGLASHRFNVSFLTSDSWPSSLPGVQVTAPAS